MKNKKWNKERKNKKAHIFMLILLVICLIAFFSLIIVIKNLVKDTRNIGEATLEVLKAAQRGEDVLNYIDVNAKYTVMNAEYELASKGGMLNSGCGEYNGVNLWYNHGKLCLPTAPNEELRKVFESKFENNLNYFELPKNNYEIKVTDNKVIGIAKEEISIKISKTDEETKVETSPIEKATLKYISPVDESVCLVNNYGSYPAGTVLLKQVTINGLTRGVNAKMADALANVAKVIDASGYKVHNWHSCRTSPNTPSCGSMHPGCLAIDINPQENPHCPNVGEQNSWWGRIASPFEKEKCKKGNAVGNIPIEIIKAFEENGFYWGGRFSYTTSTPKPDTMHFEFMTECCKRTLTPLNEVIDKVNYAVTPQEIFAQYPVYNPKEDS
ncbi:M15 family metallopeptidase [Candidatus Woesearchaeota archaeon]|nr:M15 family metallopeptidase [Candidatus Woesearchaeota archaeon]